MKSQTKSQDWIQKAERQSWEAELIVSGLAVYSTLHLETKLDQWSLGAVFQFSDQTLSFLSYIFIYLYTMQNLLLLGFALHFCMRILWIGFLGLNSVYPEGINTTSKVYPKHIIKDLKSDYPNLRAYTLQLDRWCSLIFSILCMISMAFIASAVWVFILLMLHRFIQNVFPQGFVRFIQIIFIVSLYLYLVALALLINFGPYINSIWSKRFGYKLLKNGNRLLLFLLNKPFSYINYILRTNIPSRQFLTAALLILVLAVFTKSNQEKLHFFEQKAFVKMNNFSEDVSPDNFEDSALGPYHFRPFIESSETNKNYLKLTIPFYQREQESRAFLCGTLDIPDDCSMAEKKQMKSAFNAVCSSKYYELYLNDALITDAKWLRKRVGKHHQWVYQTIIPIKNLKSGHHKLKVLLAYLPDNQQETVRIIPFYKSE